MPKKATVERAKEDLREGKPPKTAAGEFIHEEIEHVHEGKHGVRSPQQAIAIGLSKARRAGIPVAPPAKGKTKESTRVRAERDYEKGQSGENQEPSPRASRAREEALKREPHSTASHQAARRSRLHAPDPAKSAMMPRPKRLEPKASQDCRRPPGKPPTHGLASARRSVGRVSSSFAAGAIDAAVLGAGPTGSNQVLAKRGAGAVDAHCRVGSRDVVLFGKFLQPLVAEVHRA